MLTILVDKDKFFDVAMCNMLSWRNRSLTRIGDWTLEIWRFNLQRFFCFLSGNKSINYRYFIY